MEKEELLYDHYKETGFILSKNISKRNRIIVSLVVLLCLIALPDLSKKIADIFIDNQVSDKNQGNSIRILLDSYDLIRVGLYITFFCLFVLLESTNMLCKRLGDYLEDLEKDLSMKGDFFIDREGCTKNYSHKRYMRYIQSSATILSFLFAILILGFTLESSFLLGNNNIICTLIEYVLVILTIATSIFMVRQKQKYNSEGLQKITGVPVIGAVPLFVEDSNYIVVKEFALCEENEIFYNIKNNINRMCQKAKGKIILVTSNKRGTGKTFIAKNLAMALGHTRCKVIICDMNLRKKYSDIERHKDSHKGITLCLSKDKLDLQAHIKTSEKETNVDIFTSGPLSPNTNKILEKDKLNALFNELREKYDYIVLDTSDLVSVQDTILLKGFADITLLVCKYDSITSNDISRIKTYRRERLFNNLCIVLNATNEKMAPQYKYAHDR